MNTFLENIIKEKKKEVLNMELEELDKTKKSKGFIDFLKNNKDKVQLIAEIKKASPSKGIINNEVNILKQAKAYEKAGVAMISVLTDPYFFKGSIEDLKTVSEAVNVPVLCKDFIISEKQLIRAKNSGASVVLLIVAALREEELKKLYEKAVSIGLEVLVEVHDERELYIAENIGAKIIGVNNRNLHSFEVSIDTSINLSRFHSKKDVFYISESGFKTSEDVKKIKNNYSAVLIGETLMRSVNPELLAKEFMVKRNDS